MKGLPDDRLDLTPNGTTDLEQRILSRLSGRVQCFQLVVKVQGVVLRGHAKTFYAKQLAQHAVMETLALPILANEIEVR